jgi:rfaE bifunctional protein nucleotidyltransferase chain/domain
MDEVALSLAAVTESTRNKIVSLQDLPAISMTAKAKRRVVVLCHGTFDLLHIGHLRHLKAARSYGDVLVVTVTADDQVNKGPGRPVFPAELRLEMLSALDVVDHVALVNGASAEPAIEAVRPDVYVKGIEYADAEKDVSGKIVSERHKVESFGGRIEFTDDLTFSSSRLLNQHFEVFDPAVRGYLEDYKARLGGRNLFDLIERASSLRVLLVGETIIDEYHYVSALGKSAKEHMIATLYQSNEIFAGGAVAAANHVAGVCASVEILTSLGDRGRDAGCEALIRSKLRANVTLTAVYREGTPTIRKVRYVEPTYVRKLFEVYHMDETPMVPAQRCEFDELVERRAKEADIVIVTDFGHGLISRSTIETLQRAGKFLAVNTQTNSANLGFNLITKYKRADYACVDAPEARLAAGDKVCDFFELCGVHLPKLIDCPNIIVTHGRGGCFAYSHKQPQARHIPAFAGAVVDTVGAGDALFAVTAPMVAAGGDIEEVAFIGNVVGAIKVGIVGHRKYVEKPLLLKYISTLLK